MAGLKLICLFAMVNFAMSAVDIYHLTPMLVNETAGTNMDNHVVLTLDKTKDEIVMDTIMQLELTNSNLTVTKSKKSPFPLDFLHCASTFVIRQEPGTFSTAVSFNIEQWSAVKDSGNNEWTFVIVDRAQHIDAIDEDTMDIMSKRNVIIGYFDDAKMAPETELKFLDKGMMVLSNLKRNDDMNLHTWYWAYFMFYNSLPESGKPVYTVVSLVEKNSFFEFGGDEFPYCNKGGHYVSAFSQSFKASGPVWPGIGRDKPTMTGDNIKFPTHFGAHIDPPSHFYAKGYTVDKMPEYNFVPCVKIQFDGVSGDNLFPGVESLLKWEKTAGVKIPTKSLVLFDSGNYVNYDNDDVYMRVNKDVKLSSGHHDGSEGYGVNSPGVDIETAKWLLDNRDIVGIGMDALSTDVGNSTTFSTHLLLTKNQRIQIENTGGYDWFPNADGRVEADPIAKMNPIGKCLMVMMKSFQGHGAPVAVFGHFEPQSGAGNQQQAGFGLFIFALIMTIMLKC